MSKNPGKKTKAETDSADTPYRVPVYVARQPILDRTEELYGYELLFRSSEENAYLATDGNVATSTLINNVLHYLGLTELVNHKRAFVNLTRDLLIDEVYTVLPSDLAVLELLETVPVDEHVTAAFKKAKDAGYLVALDDVRSLQCPTELLAMADIVKVDLMEMDAERCRDIVEKVRSRSSATLLAEKVETRQDFEMGLELGFEFFQGFFFSKPELIKGRGLSGIESVHLALLAEIGRPTLDFEAVERLIKQDPVLTTNLLKYINSAAFGMRNEITSMRLALNLLGENAIRKWAFVAAVGCLSKHKPTELLRMCLVRAHFCEKLAIGEGSEDKQLDLFLLGMSSLLDSILDAPISEVVEQICLPPAVEATLLMSPEAPPFYASALELAQASERGDWSRVNDACSRMKQYQSEIAMIYYDSLNMANRIAAAA